jgi:hypothetical protein
MKNNGYKRALALIICLCFLPGVSALAWKVSNNSVVRRGNFADNAVTFKVPASFVVDKIITGLSDDQIELVGPKDINGFIPQITVWILADALDLDAATQDDVVQQIEGDLNGNNALCLVDEKVAINGSDALRRIFFYNGEDDRMRIMYRYDMNVSGCGVIIEYRAYTATRTLPEEVPEVPAIAETMAIQ